MNRTVQSLNGWWDYRIAEGNYTKRIIPYSDRPVGFAECRLIFDKEPGVKNKRAFLHFDGITYAADVSLNGTSLGTMLPYSEYSYEVTSLLKEKSNDLVVIISDTQVVFGPSEGWENYSGIIRDVYLEYTSSNYIKDVFWQADLKNQYTSADCKIIISTDISEQGAQMVAELLNPFDEVVSKQTVEAQEEITFDFEVEKPLLWCSETPYLYTLSVSLVDNNKIIDNDTRRVGFKELKISGKRFYLNGKPLFLIGVCRHDLFGDQGHILTEEQMRMDLQMIKDSGANYVRLVHYPHHKRIIELADELGLMVSEEPGLWWSDVKKKEIFDGSLEVLRRTVLRDRSHVSVAFWLSFNECIFTPEYLRAAADVCRKNDPIHMVSGANCMDIPMTKKYFAECGLDFYTMHPYDPTPERMIQSAVELNDKPLLLTEWGGYHVYENPHLFSIFIEEMIKTWHNTEDQPVIAGAAVWCWAEVFEFNRAAPACYNGVLCEGLVDRYRNPRSNLKVFKEKYLNINKPIVPERTMEVCISIRNVGKCLPIKLDKFKEYAGQESAWNLMIEHGQIPIERFVFDARRKRVLENGPVLPHDIKAIGELPVELLRKPIVMNIHTSFDMDLNDTFNSIYVIGNVSMPKGFPIAGEFGERIAEVVMTYSDESQEKSILRNGYEITTACAWYGPSRINPIASNAPRALYFINDTDREFYIANIYRLPVNLEKKIVSFRINVISQDYDLLLYGITGQK